MRTLPAATIASGSRAWSRRATDHRETGCTSWWWGAAGSAASSPASLRGRAGTRWPSSTRRADAFRRLGPALRRPEGRRLRLRPGHARRGRHRAAPRRWPRSPAATTPTSSPPGWPGRTSASSEWWPASTTPAGRRSSSSWASPRWPPCRGRPTRCCAGCCPPSTTASGSTPPARSRSIELAVPPGLAGVKLAALNSPGKWWLTSVTRLGTARVTTDTLILQEGDVAHFVVEVAAIPELRERRRGRARGSH